MNIESAFIDLKNKLRLVSSSIRLDSELLLMKSLNVSRAHLYTHKEDTLTEDQKNTLEQLCQRRMLNEPMAYILGKKEFWSREFEVSCATLIPRPESELLIEEVLNLTSETENKKILDLGTGSGVIAISIALERPNITVIACDISKAALKVAKRNKEQYNIENISFQESNWFLEIQEKNFDIIISNPPYIKMKDHALSQLTFEPIEALISGNDGLDAIRHIALNAKSYLNIDGLLLLEHGKDQENEVNQILTSAEWEVIKCVRDLRGFPRLTVAK
jgi:release factor glutamine methyltransferase